MIVFCLNVAQAKEAIADLKSPANASKQETKQAIKKITSIMVECELNEMCMLKMVENLTKSDKNPMYLSFLQSLESQRSRIEYNEKHCNTSEIQQVKKVIASCLKASSYDMSAVKTNNSKRKYVKEMEFCLQSNMEKLGEQGNIFAQATLANRATSLGDKTEHDKWQAKIDAKKNTSSYSVYEKCVQQYQPLPSVQVNDTHPQKK